MNKANCRKARAGRSQSVMWTGTEQVTDPSVPKKETANQAVTNSDWAPPLGLRPGINLGDPQFSPLGPRNDPFFQTVSYL